jgi:hypothetical protein
MDAMTITTALASIIGLIGTYKSESRAGEERDFDRYIDWLRRQEHHSVVNLILSNNEYTRSVRDLIEDKHGQVMAKLESLDKIITAIAGRIDIFQPLASVVGKARLSDQAVSVLHQLNEAKCGRFLEIPCEETTYEILDGSGEITFSEPRFIDDDLLTLCEYGFLRLSYNQSGDRIFTITREGAELGAIATRPV